MIKILFILLFLSLYSCDYKRDAIGGNDDIVVLAAKEDRQRVEELLSIVFNDTLKTPSPETFYNIKFAEPESFSALKTQTNLVIASIGDYDLNPGTKLVQGLLGHQKSNATLISNPVVLSKNQFAKNQLFMIISGKDAEQIKLYFENNGEYIKKMFDDNFFSKQAQYFLENERQEDIELALESDYNWTMKIPWGWEVIRNDSESSFFWIGQELPFRWYLFNGGMVTFFLTKML